jgi:hypothetical protein
LPSFLGPKAGARDKYYTKTRNTPNRSVITKDYLWSVVAYLNLKNENVVIINIINYLWIARVLRFYAGTCSASIDQARVGEPRIFKHAIASCFLLPSFLSFV